MIIQIMIHYSKMGTKLRWLSILASSLPCFISACTRKLWMNRKMYGLCRIFFNHTVLNHLGTQNEIPQMVSSILKVNEVRCHGNRCHGNMWIMEKHWFLHYSPKLGKYKHSRNSLQILKYILLATEATHGFCFCLCFTFHGYLLYLYFFPC